MTPRLILVGPPGAGKTTVGDELAVLLEVGVRDTDADVEREHGQSIADMFVDHGEEYFREAEASAVREALRSEEHTSELQSRGQLVCRLLPVEKNDGPA